MNFLAKSFAALAVMAASSAGAVTLTPSSTTVDPGNSFSLTVATEAGTGTFDGFSFNLTYDADVISYDGAVFNSFWDAPFGVTDGQSQPGGASGVITVDNITASLVVLPGFYTLSDAVDIVTLNFTALASGTTDVTVSETGEYLVTYGLSPIVKVDNTGDTASVTVAGTVPLPAGAVLLATGLLALGARRLTR